MDDIQATGVADAILIDALLGLGVDVDDLMEMSLDERLKLLAQAVDDGRVGPDYATRLRSFGLLPDPS